MGRDGFACRCCGFKSEKYQRVISLDPSSSAALDADELITVCTFCERCFSLDQAGLTGTGRLIWLPELSQAELNHVARALYIARASNDDEEFSDAASRTLEVLMARRAEAKKRLGTDDPLLLATAFHEAVDDVTYNARGEKMEGIRLFPLDRYLVRQRTGDVDVFPQMLNYWMSSAGPYGQKPVAEWKALFESVSEKTG